MSIDAEVFRARLERERERLEHARATVNHTTSLTEEIGDLAIGAGDHLADSASETFMRELDDGLGENAEHVLAEIAAALQRIDDGSFGTCVVCGGPIGEERLEAIPYATHCIDDKRALERA
jgi:RNA polymerase-binding protein DksA